MPFALGMASGKDCVHGTEEEEEEETEETEEGTEEEEWGTDLAAAEYKLPRCFVSFFLFRGFGRLSVMIPPTTISSIEVRTRT
jgi:hypothetical protein